MDDYYEWRFAKTELGNLEDLPYPGKWIEMKDFEGDAALDELARHEQTIAVSRETLEMWMHALHRIGLTLEEPQGALFIRNEIETLLSEEE